VVRPLRPRSDGRRARET